MNSKKNITKFIALTFIIIMATAILLQLFFIRQRSLRGFQPDGHLKSAVLYFGESKEWMDSFSHLEQSLAANMTVTAVNCADAGVDLSEYDIIYPDKSVIESGNDIKTKLEDFVVSGGSLFLTNDFCTFFDPAFIGAESLVKLDELPQDIVFPEAPADLQGLQGIISDFDTLYKKYYNIAELSALDYGYGIISNSATSLANCGGNVSLYGLNKCGNGYVFYTNPILPNDFSINGFSVEKRSEDQLPFANSTATANQIIKSKFAGFVSKQKFGYSLERVMGSFASPSVAWQLHYEEITGIQNGSAITFGELCKKQGIIPSYTLIRNSYKWFARYETATYLLNKDGGYPHDYNQNAYSGGSHVIEDSEYMRITEIENAGSYFVDYPEYTQRAYISVGDYNGDGAADIISGSADGFFYYYEGIGFQDGEWRVKRAQKLADSAGNALSVGEYSSPAVWDMDGDGIEDIVSGSNDGNIYLFKGNGNFTYSAGEVLMKTELTRPMPTIGAGEPLSMVVGSQNGIVQLYKGANVGGKISFGEAAYVLPELTGFAAPEIYDIDGDGDGDILVGTADGYIMRFLNDGGSFIGDGYLDTEEMNYKGNNHIKFGNNCVPRQYDIDGDHQPDLIVGSLEYGLAMPIDSPYFKYRNELTEQISYIKDNDFYLGMHFYTNQYASHEREAEELRLHKKAFESYGIDWEGQGANQHTWFVSTFSPVQTFESLWDSGILWNSGSQAANSPAVPQVSTENTLSMPFFMDFESKNAMLLNTSTLLYDNHDLTQIAAKYNLPISIYYHCDFTYADTAAAERDITRVTDFTEQNSYSFVKEDQLVKAAAAAYNAKVTVYRDKQGGSALKLSAEAAKTDFALYDKNYQDCVGVKIEFAENIDISNLSVDADVWRFEEESRAVYLSLSRLAGVSRGVEKSAAEPHILSVNVPAKVDIKENTATVSFSEGGLMQITVSGDVRVLSDSWEVTRKNGITNISKFGKADELKLEF